MGDTDKIAVVGLPDTAVKESKDRVTSANCNSGLRWPCGTRITINLASADVRKEGPSFDLPIAHGMLKLEENNRLPDLDPFCMAGDFSVSWTIAAREGCFVDRLGMVVQNHQPHSSARFSQIMYHESWVSSSSAQSWLLLALAE